MEWRILPMGHEAVLVEVGSIDEALAVRHALERAREAEADRWADVELVSGARTVLVRARGATARALHPLIESRLANPLPSIEGWLSKGPAVEVAVRYDGPDLGDVARLTGLTRAEVVAAHTGTTWRVGFAGFAPGFAYLVGGDPRLRVPRLESPRARVPAGAVALAGEFSGIYPRESPGGWRIIGTTDAPLWDPDRTPPALLSPGTAVRFVDAGADQSGWCTPDRVVHSGVGGANRMVEVVGVAGLTTVQDLGRPGLADLGVSPAGAADRAAHSLGARLVGQSPDLASLEVTLGGLAVRARAALTVALTGAPAPAAVDGRPVAHAAPVPFPAGSLLEIGMPPGGLRTYLTFRGGVAVAPVLGSRSTDTLSGLGPEPLRAGDVLPIGEPPREFPAIDVAPVPAAAAPGEVVTLTVTPGPRSDWFTHPAAALVGPWTVSELSNRVGIRLQGQPAQRHTSAVGLELPSEGMVGGAVQVPPDGQPVILLADHPVTGGYPVIAVVTAADIDRAAQLRPGQQVRLRWA